MRFLRAGTRIINVKYIIDSSECCDDGTRPRTAAVPGGIELHMLSGREIALSPDEAAQYRRAMLEFAPLPPASGESVGGDILSPSITAAYRPFAPNGGSPSKRGTDSPLDGGSGGGGDGGSPGDRADEPGSQPPLGQAE